MIKEKKKRGETTQKSEVMKIFESTKSYKRILSVQELKIPDIQRICLQILCLFVFFENKHEKIFTFNRKRGVMGKIQKNH